MAALFLYITRTDALQRTAVPLNTNKMGWALVHLLHFLNIALIYIYVTITDVSQTLACSNVFCLLANAF